MEPVGASPNPNRPHDTAKVPTRIRRGRLGDLPGLVELYLSLSPPARHAFHPFPFSRPLLWMSYFGILLYQRAAAPLMGRFTGLVVVLLVAETDQVSGLAGYGTLRGVVRADGVRCVRYGSVVRDGLRGRGVGHAILVGLGEQALVLGVHTAIGTVFRSDARTIQVVRRFGFVLHETDWVDPGAPGELNYELVADLRRILRPGGGLDSRLDPTPEIAPRAGGEGRRNEEGGDPR
jgi:GNAT superfamily N-acetyltransferase